jgi:ABC-type uncharacterized transport system substrate-binding protein
VTRGRLPVAALLVSWLGGAAPSVASPRGANVLILDHGPPGRPFSIEMHGAFRAALGPATGSAVSIYEETLDLERFPGEAHVLALRRFLAEKYRERPPDVIAAHGDPALRFVAEWRDPPWPAPAVVFATASEATARASHETAAATGVVVDPDIEATLRAALALLPETEEVAIVASADPSVPVVEAALARIAGRVRVTRLVDLSLEETRRRLAALPPTAIVYYSQVTLDREGRGLFGREALEELAAASRRPIFSRYGTYLGYGIVGGSLLQPEVVGREMAGVVARVLAGTPAARIPVEEIQANRLLFDARQLKRFGLDESRLPPGSEVRFREPTLLEEHRGAVVTAAVLLSVQAGLIVALAAAVQRRRMAQRQLRLLGGRILTAQ